jgi:hypothetical protein
MREKNATGERKIKSDNTYGLYIRIPIEGVRVDVDHFFTNAHTLKLSFAKRKKQLLNSFRARTIFALDNTDLE